MDQNSTYVLKINLLGNPKKARKDIKCFCFDKVIDFDLTNYKDLVESIVEQYSPRYLEVAVKVHARRKSKEVVEITPHLPIVPLDSPAMSTRSKRRLSL